MLSYSVVDSKKSPPQLEPEDEIVAGISLAALTEDQFARKCEQIEDRVHYNGGIWWRQNKFGWYQPCFPLVVVDHSASRPSRFHAVSGYTHIAAVGTPTNSKYRTIMHTEAECYRFRSLPKDRRANVRRALATLTVRPVENVSELVTDGYEIYLSCHNRIRWGRDKSNRAVFQRWIARAYRQKGFALGAYKGSKLVGFMLPHRIDDTIVMSYTASHSDFLQYRPNDALYHALLSIARQSQGVARVDFGPLCAKQSLNQFKLTFASEHVFPAFTWVNPLIRRFVKDRISSHYPWLSIDSVE